MADITPARKLYDLLASKDFEPEILDSAGKPATDPSQAEIFSFDFRAESGKDYGTVVIMLSDTGDLEVYCADNVGKTMEGADKSEWFAFLEQLKNFAVRTNRMNFGIKNLNHLRYSMQGQAAIKEGLFESWQGKKDVSWNAGATESRLMIKHKRSLGEGEARFRYVESLFIETADGERYKLPFKNLTAGKAMLEHVRTGGRPYDLRGQHIAEMVTELTLLSRFRRANTGKLLEGDTATLVEQATVYFETLKTNLKSLTTRRGYETYFETWSPMELSKEEVVIEGLKHLFVTQSIDQRIEEALPLIARIQQQENAMKEANIFEAWANQLMEGTWQTPDTPEKQSKLIELLSKDLPVGADATNATEQLYALLGDDELFDQLQALAKQDANADARQVILNRMQELDQDPDVMKVITSLNIDATAEMNPPEQTPADLDSDEDKVEEMLGGDASDDFIRDVSIKQPQDEMEEAVKDPAYPEYQDDLATILKNAGVDDTVVRAAPDYETEMTDETTTAQMVKQILSPFGTAAGAAAGSGGGGKAILLQPVGEQGTNSTTTPTKKNTSSILPAVAAGAAGAGLGYMAGKALGSSSTPKPTPTSSSSSSFDSDIEAMQNHGSWGAPGTPTATGKNLGIDMPAAGSPADIALTGMLETELDEKTGPAAKIGFIGGGVPGAAIGTAIDTLTGANKEKTEEGGLGTAVGAGLGGAVGGLGGAALGGLAGYYLTKDKEAKKESNDLNRMSDLAGIKKKVADESLLAPLVGAVGGAALGGELASGIGSKFGSEVGGSIGQAAGQEQAGKLGALVGGMKGSSAGAAAGGAAAKKFGQVAGGIAGIAGGAAINQAKKSNDDTEETNEGWKGQLAGGLLGTIGGGMAGAAMGGPIGAMIGSAAGGGAGGLLGNKLGGDEREEQLNEVGPAIAIGARLLMPMLSRIGPALGRAAASAGKAGADATGKAAAGVGRGAVELGKSAAQSAAKNAVPIGIGAGAYQAITDVATGLVGGVGEVYNDAGTAASALAKMVGNSLDKATIESLALAAVKYAIPIGILIAVLYGGKKLIDKVFSESAIDEGRCNMSEAGESCPQHGLEECAMEGQDHSPLAGQYGHSGKMKAVDKDTTFLDRLRELSGMMRK
jgi:hypothetical protein